MEPNIKDQESLGGAPNANTASVKTRPNLFLHGSKTSRYNGVSYNKWTGLWTAYTGGAANRVQHGHWINEHDAARARNLGQIQRFGFDPHPNVIEESESDFIRYTFVGTRVELILTLAQMKAASKPVVLQVLSPERLAKPKQYFKLVMPLVRVQPYICGLTEMTTDPTQVEIVWDKRVAAEPWLVVPSPDRQASVIIDRKPSAINPQFAWSKAIGETNGDCIFAGVKDDYQLFRAQTGIHFVKFLPVMNLLAMAQLIAGADLFIGNRSSGWAIAKGLGKPCVVEP